MPTKKPEPMKLEEGKVYLRDTRTGKIRQYEDSLAQMSYMERFVAGEEDRQVTNLERTTGTGYSGNLSGLDRAAEWDRLAAMKPEDRDKAVQEANKAGTSDAKGVAEPASGSLAATPQTVTAPAPDSAAPLTPEQVQANATAAPAAPATASGSVAVPPAPPPPPTKQEAKQETKETKQEEKADTAKK